jgi:tryptophan-rich sensory protein
MIAVAGWRAWLAGGMSAAIIVWGVNILANGLWSYLMFGQNRIDLALIDIALLWTTIVAFIALTWNLDRTAAWLFVPYLVWVSYASALNFAIWRTNP